MSKPQRPSRSDITNSQFAEQLFQKGPADVSALNEISIRARDESDKAAEAIARFAVSNDLDGNVPGADRRDHAEAIKEFTRA